MKKVIEKITKVCCVWKWCLFNLQRSDKKGNYAVLSKEGRIGNTLGVLSIGIDKNKNIALIKNYRHAIDKLCWEMVRGALEKGLSVEENAIKEFKEEIGNLNPLKVRVLGNFAPDSGIIGGYVAAVLLEFDDFSKYDIWQFRDGTKEDIYEVKYVSTDEFEEMILNGDIVDNFTLSAYGLLKLYKII